MSQISFFRLVSVKVSNKGLEKKFNIAIAVLFSTIIGYAIACVSQRMIGDQSIEHYSIGPIHQVSYNKNVCCGSNHLVTLDSGIHIGVCLLIFGLFSSGYIPH